MGGGHSFIEALGTNGTGAVSITEIFGISVVASILIVVLFKFIAGVLAMSCGVPCGVFIPMLAIGAGVGAVFSLSFQKLGMSADFGDYLVIISMAVFFTTVVKAPITGIVMVFELTGQFTNFLPALIGIAVGYLIGMLFKTEAIYEKSLEGFIAEEKLYENIRKIRVSAVVQAHSRADGTNIRTIIWPTNGLVVQVITEDGKVNVPDGETVMRAGETIVFECETDSEEELQEYIYGITGKPER